MTTPTLTPTPNRYAVALREKATEALAREVRAEMATLPCAWCEAVKSGSPFIPKPSLPHCETHRRLQQEWSRGIYEAESPSQLQPLADSISARGRAVVYSEYAEAI